MLTYRRIETDQHFAETIWQAEESAPRWFRESSHIWTPTFESFLEFWQNCREIYGLFDGGKLLVCVYLEFLAEHSINIHISVVEAVKSDATVRFFSSLRRKKHSEGVTDMRGWILSKNRHLIGIVEQSGFRKTGLKMDYGESNARVLRWIEMRS